MTPPPNVVWITLESTRADHTTIEDYEHDTTPNLVRIAADTRGQALPECISHGVWTLPSSASILTGTYPSHHGAGMGYDAIPEALPTVSERFQRPGYTTASLSPNSHISEATGLDRGFDSFRWVSSSTLLDSVGYRTSAKYFLHARSHGGGLTFDPQKHGADFMMVDVAKRWVRSFHREATPFSSICT